MSESRQGKSPSDIRLNREHVDALTAVLRQEVDRATETAAMSARGPRRRRGRQVVFGLLLVFSGYLWLADPAWLEFGRPVPEPTATDIEAPLRLTMYLQVQRIEAFRQRTGRLPITLDEAGPPLDGMEYQETGVGRYRLIGTAGPVSVAYTSVDSPRSLLDRADTLLTGGS